MHAFHQKEQLVPFALEPSITAHHLVPFERETDESRTTGNQINKGDPTPPALTPHCVVHLEKRQSIFIWGFRRAITEISTDH